MALTRTLTLYSGSDSLPALDYTDDTDWTQVELGSLANNGEAEAGQWLLRNETGVIPDHVPPTRYIQAHNVVVVTVGSNTLFRGRVAAGEIFRGRQKAARAIEINVTLEDQNSHLRGIVVHNWVRPAETDSARAQALVAAYLSGNPRPTTNLNGSNLIITGSNAISLPAKTYSGVTPFDVMQELSSNADKEMFVTIDNELAYFGHDYTGYASLLRISDLGYPAGADANANTYAPWDPRNTTTGREFLSRLRGYYGTDVIQSTYQLNVGSSFEAVNDYWEEVYWDSESVTAAQADARGRKILDFRSQDDTTFSCSIGPMSGDQIYKIKPGQQIQFKSRAAVSGRGPSGAFAGDSFITTRVRQVRWTMPAEDMYIARLELERPRRTKPGGNAGNPGSQALATAPSPPPECDPPEQPADVLLADTEGGGAHVITWPGALTTAGACWSGVQHYNKGGSAAHSGAVPVSVGDVVTGAIQLLDSTGDAAWEDTSSYNYHVGLRLMGSGMPTLTTVIVNQRYHAPGSPGACTGPGWIENSATVPAGYTTADLYIWQRVGGMNYRARLSQPSAPVDNTCPVDSVPTGTSGESPYYARYDDPRFDGIGLGTMPWFIVTEFGATGDGTTDDTDSVNAAIAALVSAGKGVLYFPAGTYKTTAALTTISVPALILGDGSEAFDGSESASLITCTSGTANLFTVTADHARFEKIALENTAGTPSAGSGIKTSGSYIEQRVDYEGVIIRGFYINWDIQVGAQWTMHGCGGLDPVLYAVKIQNTVNPDAGDWAISDCHFNADSHAATAAIRIQSSGGGKIVNTKINMGYPADQQFTNGIDLTVAAAIATGDLQITAVSIENVTGDAIHVRTNSSKPSHWGAITVTGLQVALWGNTTGSAIDISADALGDIEDVTINGLVVLSQSPSTATAIDLTKVDNVFIGGVVQNQTYPFATLLATSGCTNIVDAHTGAGGTAGGDLSGTYPNPSVVDDSHSHTASTISGVIETGDAAGGDLSGTYPNPSVVDDSHSHTATTLPASSSGDHAHVVDELLSGDAVAVTFDLANEALPESAIAYVAGARTSVTVTGTLNDQILFAVAPGSGTDNISVDYVAVLS